MSVTSTSLLPPARIRCDPSGRIRVGNRNYLSASEALSVYLEQFDKRKAFDVGLNGLDSHSVLAASVNSLSSYGDFTVLHGGLDPKAVTSNLTTLSAHDAEANYNAGAEYVQKSSSSPSGKLNECELGHPSSHPNYLYSSQTNSLSSLSAAEYDSTCTMKLPGLGSAEMSGIQSPLQTRPRVYDSAEQASACTRQPSHFGYTDLSLQQQLSRATSSDMFHHQNSMEQPERLPGSWPSSIKGKDNDKGVIEFLDFHCTQRSGDLHEQSGPILLTTMPSQRELKNLAQDAMREAKLKRLLREASSRSADSDIQTAESQWNRSVHSGEHPVRDVSNDKLERTKIFTTEADTTAQSCHGSKNSTLRTEVEEALCRSAKLLDTVQSSCLLSTTLAKDVSSRHNADTLLSSISLPDNPHPVSCRMSRRGHRYSYRSHGPRSRSVDGTSSPRQQQSHLESGPTRSQSLDRLNSPRQQSSLREDGRLRSVDCGPPPASLVAQMECVELKRSASSVWSACEDILKELQAVNPTALPEVSGEKIDFHGKLPTMDHSLRLDQKNSPASSGNMPKDRNCVSSADYTFSEKVVSGEVRCSPLTNGFDQQKHFPCIDISKDRGGINLKGELDISFPSKPTKGNKAEDSNDLSYTGPGLNYSDLAVSPARCKETKNRQSHRPPKAPPRPPRSNDVKNGDTYTSPTSINPIPKNNDVKKRLIVKSDPDLRHTSQRAGSQSNHSMPAEGESSDSSQLLLESKEVRLFRSVQSGGDVPRMSDAVASEDRNGVECSWVSTSGIVNALQGYGQPVSSENGDPRSDGLNGGCYTAARHPDDKTQMTGNDDGSQSSSLTSHNGHVPHVDIDCGCLLKDIRSSTSVDGFSVLKSEEAASRDEAAELIPALDGYDFELQPGGQSLERALVHLGRLKSLVQKPTFTPSPSASSLTSSVDSSLHQG